MSVLNAGTVRSLTKTLRENRDKTKAYDTRAEVRRVVGNTAYVHIPGGVEETPVALTIGAKKGDTVQIHVGGGRAWITGNLTAPPEDNSKAIEAVSKVNDNLGVKIKQVETEKTDTSQISAAIAQIKSRVNELTSAVTELGNSKANADGNDIIDLLNSATGSETINQQKIDPTFLTAEELANNSIPLNITNASGEFTFLSVKDQYLIYTVDPDTEEVQSFVMIVLDDDALRAFANFTDVYIGSFENDSMVHVNNVTAGSCTLVAALEARIAELERICGVTNG